MRLLPILPALFFCSRLGAQSPQAVTPASVLARTANSTAVVLSGAGSGRLTGLSTAVVVRPDGVLLTVYHPLKNAREVQVRLKNGETFDRVVLLGVDTRRNIAAIKIPAAKLPALAPATASDPKPGEAAFTVSNANGTTWTATQGIFSATRMADEIQGIG